MKKTLIIGLVLFSVSYLRSQNLAEEGVSSNRWIAHTPDDGGTSLLFAPFSNGVWDWSKRTEFFDNGGVYFSGNLGIGTTNPAHKLVVQGDSSPNIELKNANYSNGGFILNRTNYGNQWKWWAENNQMYFDFSTNESTYSNKLTINSNGNVGIGTITPDEKLAVNGNIHGKEVRVDLIGWSDFVFNKDYNLPTLNEVENHIKEKGHLKDIPSAKEVAENGILLGDMNAKLLQKIEELTLYAINQEKRIETLETENKTLKKQEERITQLEEKLALLSTKK